MSQSNQATPKPAAQVSNVKPAQFEKPSSGSGMAAKPRLFTATSSEVTHGGVAAGGSASVGRAGKAKPETAAVSQVKASTTVPSAAGAAVTKPKESPKSTAKSATATTTVKADVHKVDPAKTPKPVATLGSGYVSVSGKTEARPTQHSKVQVEIPPAAAKGVQEVDPFDALASILPSADAIAPRQPVYTGPEVTELNVTSEEGHMTGGGDCPLPPGYRFEDMPPAPADVKPQDVPKPMSTGEALDSLSDAFMTPAVAPQKPEKKVSVESVSASSAGPANFAPPPVKTGARPPADKKAKMEEASCDFSLASGLNTKPKTDGRTVCPPKEPGVVMAGRPQQAKTDAGDSMSLDALSALVDTLPEDKPKPKLPELRPEDIVSEEKHKKEKGVLVGERDDSIHPDYRFKEDQLKKLPAPKPEPTMATGDALDILSEGFMTSSAAPVVQAPVVTPSAPPAQSSGDFVLNAMAADFVSSSASTTLKSAVCAPTEAASELHAGPGSALDALSDTLKDIAPAPQPAPPPAKDLVKEKKAVEERLIKMGERDDSLPPEYRPTEEDLKAMAEAKAKAAAAPKEKKMDDKTALDLLSSDFSTDPAAAAAPAAAVATQLVPPVLDSEPLKPMAGPVLDSLSGTLLPDAPGFKSKADKPKGKSKSKSKSKKHHAEEPSASEQLPAPPSSDVVPKSTKKGGRS